MLPSHATLPQHIPYLTVRETLSFVHRNACVDPSTHGYPHLAAEHAVSSER